MEQADINKLMDDHKSTKTEEKKPVKTDKIKSGKWPILSKFLKDVGHFVFDEKSASDELKKDLAALESTRAEEHLKEKAEKLAQAKKLEEERAKAKLLKQKAEEEAKKKVELAKQAQMSSEKIKKMSLKTRLANHFKKERESFDQKQKAMAEHLLQVKAKQVAPTPPSLKPVSNKPKFNWFKSKPKIAPVKISVPAPIATSMPITPISSSNVPSLAPLTGSQESKPGLMGNKDQATNKFKEERLKHQNLSQKEQIENRSWESFGVVHTNLIRGQRGMFLNWQSKLLWLLLFVALAGLASVAAYGFLLILEKDKISSTSGTFTNLTSIITQIQSEEVYAEEILSFNNKLLAVDYLLNNHIYWTNFFKFLEDYTTNDVYYEKFSGDLSGKYLVPAVAKDYSSVSTQLRVLQSATDKVMGVDTGGAASANKGVTPVAVSTPIAGDQTATSTPTPSGNVKFDLNLTLNRSIFIKEPQYVD